MRAIVVSFVLLLALASVGCLRKTEFQCSGDNACGAGGRCEPTSFCSFADPDCETGRRYDQSAGPLAGQCTGGGTMTDGRVPDMPGMMGDGPGMDMGPPGCPGDYAPITGGEGNHIYKALLTAENWNVQESACQLTSSSSHLAVPGEIMELTALDTLAGGLGNNYWIGITDSATEGTYLNVLGATQTYLPWETGAPNNAGGGQGEDCVESTNSAIHEINDRRCQDKLAAVCECVPP